MNVVYLWGIRELGSEGREIGWCVGERNEGKRGIIILKDGGMVLRGGEGSWDGAVRRAGLRGFE